MKSFGLVSNVLVLVSYIQLKTCFASEEKTLIRRSQHQPAPIGHQCHHACDCKGYPLKPVCCEKRGPDKHKKCYICCFKNWKPCLKNKDCCSQKCRKDPKSGKRVCIPNHDIQIPDKLCPILFPGDYILAPIKGPPFAPMPSYVQPRITGPLRRIDFCPLAKINLQGPEGNGRPISEEDEQAISSLKFPPIPGPKPVLMYLVKGQCDIDIKWRIIQGGLLMKHWDGKCFKIPIIDYKQLKVPGHPAVDYTKYHVVFFWKWGKTVWPLWLLPLKLNEELRMWAKCRQALPYLLHAHP